MMQKSTLRQECIKKRGALAKQSRTHAEALIIERVAQWLADHTADAIGIYHPIHNEVSLLGLPSIHPAAYALPVVQGTSMYFARWHEGMELHKSRYGILEPTAPHKMIVPDIILLPMVGFDERGYRLGYGSGYYDRYFDQLAQKHIQSPIRIGVAFACQKVTNLPNEPHDVTLHRLMTEEQEYSFNVSS